MDEIVQKAFEQGGMAIAFVIMLWAYRELAQRRVDELKTYVNQIESDKKLLMDIVQGVRDSLAQLNVTMRSVGDTNGKIIEKLDDQQEALNAHRIAEERLLRGKSAQGG